VVSKIDNSDKTHPVLTLFKVPNAMNTGTHLLDVKGSEMPENIGKNKELDCILPALAGVDR
jgi:hypothetical protein